MIEIGEVNSPLGMAIVLLSALGIGVLLGCSLVYGFNHMPAKWLCDYGQEPSEKVRSPHGQRLPGMPWKWVFSATFIVLGMYTGVHHWVYAIAVLAACWFLFQIAIGDLLYHIIPDEMVLGLTVTALGFIPFHDGIRDMGFGALIGCVMILLPALIGKGLFRREVMGFGDVKLGIGLGFVLGIKGTLFVLPAGLLLGGIAGALLLISKRKKAKDEMALGPYLALSATIYLVFFMTPMG